MLLASLISVQTLMDSLNVVGYPAIVLFIFIECVGVPLPGETILLLAAFLAATGGHLHLLLVILFAAFAAIVGDNVGYLLGRTGGRALVMRFGRFFFIKESQLEWAEAFFARHGPKTVFFGRFVSLLRIWAAFLAGMNRMHWASFLFYNALGGIIWSIYVSLLGYIAGSYFHEHFDQVEWVARTVGWAGLALIVGGVLIAIAVVKLRRTRQMRLERHTQNAPLR